MSTALRFGARHTNLSRQRRRFRHGNRAIYFAGEEYGPEVLLQLDDWFEPLVKKVSKDIVEIYFGVGTHGHISGTRPHRENV